MNLTVFALARASLLFLAGFAFAIGHAETAAPITAWFAPNPAWQAGEDIKVGDGASKLEVLAGGNPRVMVLANPGAKAPHLRSNAYLNDIVVSAEYLFTAGAEAAIFLNSTYRIRLDGESAGTIGPIVPRDGSGKDGFIAPTAAAAGTPGVWHRIEARLRSARFNEASAKVQNALLIEVKIDGVAVHQNVVPLNWSRGTETEWESDGGQTTFAVAKGSLAVRNFALHRADFGELAVPAESGGETNVAALIDYVQQGADLFKGLGCVECHATQRDDHSQKMGPNLFGLFQSEPRDREIEAGEGHRFTVKADRFYLNRALRSPFEELAIAESGPNKGKPYLPAMPPIMPNVATDAQIDAIGAYLATLNEPQQQGPVVKYVKETGLENYDPMHDRFQLLVDQVVRLQRGPMAGMSGRTVHVGLPSGINYSFDPRLLSVVQLWQGGFLDMSGEFLNRGGGGLKPGYDSREIKLGGPLAAPLNAAGETIDFSFVSPIFRDGAAVRASLYDERDIPDRLKALDAQFLGYERDSTRATAAPTFRYRVGRNTIALRHEFGEDGVVRLVVSGDFATPQSFALNSTIFASAQASAGKVAGARWNLPAGQHRDVTLVGKVMLAPKFWRPTPSEFGFRKQPLVTAPAQPLLPRGYSAESYQSPKDNYGREMLFEALGMDLAPDGAVVVATRTAGIWRLVQGEWQLFAEGLFDSLGVQVEDQHGFVVVAGQKAEVTRISDINGDGLADKYETMTDAFSYIGNYHSYVHGPVRDTNGDYLITLNLNDSGQTENEYNAGGKYMGTGGGFRGWAARVPKAGGFEPFADGLRSPASLGRAPDGRMWYADNQGEYMGTSKLFVLREGAFYGHPAGLVDRPGMTPKSPEIAWEKVKGRVEPAVVLLPQGRLANSPGNPAWDTTGGRFGAFAGQLFMGDQTQSNLMRLSTEKVGRHEQGAAINFGTKLESGIMRPLFLPDGSLLLGQTGRGWQAKGGHVTSLQRIRWDGHTVAPAIHHVSAIAGGFEVTFTAPVPMDFDPASLASGVAVKSWVYRDAADYGSFELDEHPEVVTTVNLDSSRTKIRLTLEKTSYPPVHPEQTARVYQLTIDGKKIWNETGPGFEAFYTLYEFPKPE